ncbi:MAG: lamin tail domain-containing protein [Proteobacteria bacterium]|nr:lamin tail domain-containing protein [Pseudomonadota bacterium]
MNKIIFLCLMGTVIHTSQAELLITELVIIPNNAEFIEIHNSGVSSIDLTNVYLTDATFSNGGVYYYNIPTGADYGGGGFSDFHARFPTGASINPGSYQTIALNGSDDFFSAYGINPTYELYEDAGSPDAIADMLEAVAGSISGQGNLTDNSGEVVILYNWDGSTDLVQDIDYVVWGDKVEAVDKTGVSIDGPDADTTLTVYNDDTSIINQAVISANTHANGSSWNRSDMNEGNETDSGGNGITGHDETSENLNVTFYEDAPSPNLAGTPPPPTAPNIVINEVDAVGSVEFIEIFDAGSGNTGLDGVTLIFYDGHPDLVYDIYDLTGQTTNNDGFFLIGDSSLTPEVTLSVSSLQDGADAIALYFSEASNFTIGDAVVTADLIDALVYDSGQADDSELLLLLNTGQSQVNENSNLATASESSARCANGAGGQLNTQTYRQVSPTPGVINNLCPIEEYYVNVDPTDAGTLRRRLHKTIKVAVSFP